MLLNTWCRLSQHSGALCRWAAFELNLGPNLCKQLPIHLTICGAFAKRWHVGFRGLHTVLIASLFYKCNALCFGAGGPTEPVAAL